MKKISILGSTGSIGTQTLDVVREHGDMQVMKTMPKSFAQVLRIQTSRLVMAWTVSLDVPPLSLAI